ncbi:hypothetical protein U0070_013278, partial [Myodes glareolus]
CDQTQEKHYIRNQNGQNNYMECEKGIGELIPKGRDTSVKIVVNHFHVMQNFKLTRESILMINLTDVKNVASPLPRTQIFTDIAESILVRNLTDVKHVAGSQIFTNIAESILVRNLTDVKNVASPSPQSQLFILITESIL